MPTLQHCQDPPPNNHLFEECPQLCSPFLPLHPQVLRALQVPNQCRAGGCPSDGRQSAGAAHSSQEHSRELCGHSPGLPPALLANKFPCASTSVQRDTEQVLPEMQLLIPAILCLLGSCCLRDRAWQYQSILTVPNGVPGAPGGAGNSAPAATPRDLN
ncbi:hypothetical protein Nmel_002757 [Mimus melanotis]